MYGDGQDPFSSADAGSEWNWYKVASTIGAAVVGTVAVVGLTSWQRRRRVHQATDEICDELKRDIESKAGISEKALGEILKHIEAGEFTPDPARWTHVCHAFQVYGSVAQRQRLVDHCFQTGKPYIGPAPVHPADHFDWIEGLRRCQSRGDLASYCNVAFKDDSSADENAVVLVNWLACYMRHEGFSLRAMQDRLGRDPLTGFLQDLFELRRDKAYRSRIPDPKWLFEPLVPKKVGRGIKQKNQKNQLSILALARKYRNDDFYKQLLLKLLTYCSWSPKDPVPLITTMAYVEEELIAWMTMPKVSENKFTLAAEKQLLSVLRTLLSYRYELMPDDSICPDAKKKKEAYFVELQDRFITAGLGAVAMARFASLAGPVMDIDFNMLWKLKAPEEPVLIEAGTEASADDERVHTASGAGSADKRDNPRKRRIEKAKKPVGQKVHTEKDKVDKAKVKAVDVNERVFDELKGLGFISLAGRSRKKRASHSRERLMKQMYDVDVSFSQPTMPMEPMAQELKVMEMTEFFNRLDTYPGLSEQQVRQLRQKMVAVFMYREGQKGHSKKARQWREAIATYALSAGEFAVAIAVEATFHLEPEPKLRERPKPKLSVVESDVVETPTVLCAADASDTCQLTLDEADDGDGLSAVEPSADVGHSAVRTIMPVLADEVNNDDGVVVAKSSVAAEHGVVLTTMPVSATAVTLDVVTEANVTQGAAASDPVVEVPPSQSTGTVDKTGVANDTSEDERPPRRATVATVEDVDDEPLCGAGAPDHVAATRELRKILGLVPAGSVGEDKAQEEGEAASVDEVAPRPPTMLLEPKSEPKYSTYVDLTIKGVVAPAMAGFDRELRVLRERLGDFVDQVEVSVLGSGVLFPTDARDCDVILSPKAPLEPVAMSAWRTALQKQLKLTETLVPVPAELPGVYDEKISAGICRVEMPVLDGKPLDISVYPYQNERQKALQIEWGLGNSLTSARLDLLPVKVEGDAPSGRPVWKQGSFRVPERLVGEVIDGLASVDEAGGGMYSMATSSAMIRMPKPLIHMSSTEWGDKLAQVLKTLFKSNIQVVQTQFVVSFTPATRVDMAVQHFVWAMLNGQTPETVAARQKAFGIMVGRYAKDRPEMRAFVLKIGNQQGIRALRDHGELVAREGGDALTPMLRARFSSGVRPGIEAAVIT